MKPVVWGIMGTAMIARERVIPATQASPICEVGAIASRDQERAAEAARAQAIPRSHGGYEALLDDPKIEAVYIPLPNHMHLEWSAKALRAGKHVLTEKPIAMNAGEVAELIRVRDETGCWIEEAVMTRNHTQWSRIREWLDQGRIGELSAIQASFTYVNLDPDDIRNHTHSGGGGLMDIGSYCLAMCRFAFDAEPRRVVALMERDPRFGTDRLASALLDFEAGQAIIFCSTQVTRHEQMMLYGTEGWMRVETPFVQPPTHSCRVMLGDGAYPGHAPAETVTFDPVNHYTLQAERFSRLIRGESVARWPLETAQNNMKVIDALFRSAESGRWVTV